MKILIISRAIFPNLAPRAHRATELAKEFAREGHEVTLCAVLGKYDYSSFQKEHHITIDNLGISNFEWISSDSSPRSISLWRKGIIFLGRKWFLFPDILLAKRVTRYLKTHRNNFDLIITIAIPYPIHWGMARAKQKGYIGKHTTWVSDCGDPFMGNPFAHYPFYFKYVEKWWCHHTDYISIPTLSAVNGYYPNYRNKIKIIPQGFRFDSVTLAKYEKNKVPTFAYSGMVYPQKRDPREFLDHLTQVSFDFKFVVYNNKPALFEPYKERLKEKLEIRDYIPHDELLYELSKMDFLINIQNESTVQAPSKLIDYYLTKRPILDISSHFTAQKTFEEFCQGNYAQRLHIENANQYDIKNVCFEFLNFK